MRIAFLWLAILILLCAATLRFWRLSDLPPGPHYDEAVNVIVVRTIAYGGARPFPMIENYQGREVLYYYLSLPLLLTVQDSRLALQLTSAYLNLLLVAGTIALGRVMFKGERGWWIGLVAGGVAAVSVPQILLARQAFRAITLPTMQALALVFLWRGLSVRRGAAWLIAGGIFGGLALYTYNSSRLFPLWLALAGLALLLWSQRQRLQRLQQGALFFVPLVLIALPFGIYALYKPEIFLGRLYEVTGGANEVTLAESVWLHVRMFFWHGETLLRYNPIGRPYFTLAEGVFLLMGIGLSLRTLVQRNVAPLARAAALLLALSPLMILPSVISTSGLPPNHMRSIGMVPLVFLLVGVGAERFLRGVPRARVFVFIAALMLGVQVSGTTYFTWASRADLYYDTDADLAAAAQWLVGQPASVRYVAAADRYHPTVQVFTEDVRWLGTDTLFLPAQGDALAVFPRSAPPPDDWRAWLAQGERFVVSGLPTAPDNRPAFEAVRLSDEMQLPPNIASVTEGAQNGVLQLKGRFVGGAFPSGRVDVVTAWEVLNVPPMPDLTPILLLQDALGNTLVRGESFSVGTDTWQSGELLLQRVSGVRVPVGTPAGEYTLRLAWVARSTDTYLPYSTPDGEPVGLWLDVGTLEVLRPNNFPSATELNIPVTATHALTDDVHLLGWDNLPATLRPGEPLDLTLYWQAQNATVAPTYTLLLDGQPIAHESALPVRAQDWLAGQLTVERVRLVLPKDTPNDTLRLSLTAGTSTVDLGALEAVGVPRLFTAPPVQTPLEAADFDAQIRLHGYTLTQTGQGLQLELVWLALAEIPTNYTVFVHLRDANGAIIAQQDQQPMRYQYPTSLWQVGEYVRDSYNFENIGTANMSIQIGLYDQASGARMQLPSGESAFNIPTLGLAPS